MARDESILTSIKKMLGPEEVYTQFDQDIITHINTELMTLTQLGIGPEEGFMIESKEEKWADFLGESKKFAAVKTFIYIKVRLVFDPPSSSTVIDAFERKAKELESRLQYNTGGDESSG